MTSHLSYALRTVPKEHHFPLFAKIAQLSFAISLDKQFLNKFPAEKF
jgi:hypothetical protein